MENGPKPKNPYEFSLEKMLEMAHDPARRAQAQLAIEHRKEELEGALQDAENAGENPGPEISRSDWREESKELERQIAELDDALVQIRRMSTESE